MCVVVFIEFAAIISSAPDLLRQQLITQSAPSTALQMHSEGELITITLNITHNIMFSQSYYYQ